MRERSIAALIVPMEEMADPSFRWLSRGAKLTRGVMVARPGQELLLVHHPMERDEAAASGLPTLSVQQFGYDEIFRSEPDLGLAWSRLFSAMLRSLAVDGPIAFFGRPPIHLYAEVLDGLRAEGWSIWKGGGEDLLQLARKRKDARELRLIGSVGERTEKAVQSVRLLLRSAVIRDGIAHRDGKALSIGDLKERITSEIIRLGMTEDHETIVSQGRDAGIPHSRGDATAPVHASLPLVIDIFPADRQSGYFFDLTRTFCIGSIPGRLREMHAQVLEAFDLAVERCRAGTRASDLQDLVCDFFEERGHPTVRSTPATHEGYVHGLGHGVGLEVHEKPSFSLHRANADRIETGDVLTIEPGLYYPDEGLGVRIEDTLFVREDGRLETFCRSSRALEP
ncbi:MAG TPA: M24 family metallopeptidase [Thermoanaerobaculia bacterium]|nr:M24 family metallopeptidase [Thermoanaerobaculia bacterium]